MSKRVFIIESEELGSAIVDYVRKMIGETPETDNGKYSLTFIPNANGGPIVYQSAKVKRWD